MAKVARKDIAKVVLELAGSVSHKALVKSVAAYLMVERRTGELEPLMRDVARLRAKTSGVTEATVTSAFPVTNEVKSQIKDLLKADKLVLNETIDNSVVGGVRVETSEQKLDLTVRNRLDRLKSARNAA